MSDPSAVDARARAGTAATEPAVPRVAAMPAAETGANIGPTQVDDRSGSPGEATAQASPDSDTEITYDYAEITYDYADVPYDHFAALDIAALAVQGVLAGTDCAPALFCPDDFMPRWQPAVWIARVLLDGDDPEARDSRFTDIEGSPWWESHVEHLADLGVIRGCQLEGEPLMRFCPHDTLTRADMAALINRAFNFDDAEPAGFVDIEGIHSQDAINRLAQAGVTLGCRADAFCPQRLLKRGEMAALLNRGRFNPDDPLNVLVDEDEHHIHSPDVRWDEDPPTDLRRVTLKVYICAKRTLGLFFQDETRFNNKDLIEEVKKLNGVVTQFFEVQSNGKSVLNFVPGRIIPIERDGFSNLTIDDALVFNQTEKVWEINSPCFDELTPGEMNETTATGRTAIYMIFDGEGRQSDIAFGVPTIWNGVELGLPPRIMMPSRRYHEMQGGKSYHYDGVSAHEVGHAIYGLSHTFDGGDASPEQGNREVISQVCSVNNDPVCGDIRFDLEERARSLMSYRTYGSHRRIGGMDPGRRIPSAYVSCIQRAWLGWPHGCPDAPPRLVATAGNGEVRLSWRAPNGNGAPITSYVVESRSIERTSGGNTWSAWVRRSTPQTTADTVRSLTNGTDYQFRVSAFNSEGLGPSALVRASPTPEPQSILAPSTPSVSLSKRDTSLTASWSADGRGSDIQNWQVRLNSGRAQTRSASTTTWTWNSLNAGTYSVSVRARNSNDDWSDWGTSDPVRIGDSSGSLAVTRGDVGVSGPCALDSGCRWVHGSGSGWTPSAQFWIKCGDFVDTSRNIPVPYRDRFVDTNGNLSWGDGVCLSDGPHSVEVWTVQDGRATGTAPAFQQRVTVPDAPSAPNLDSGNGQITVSWDVPNGNGARVTSYQVNYIDDGAIGDGTSRSTTNTSLTVRGLTNGRDYVFRVRARTGSSSRWSDWSAWSPYVTGRPLGDLAVPDSPSAPSLVPGDGQVTVSWRVPNGNGARVSSYQVQYGARDALRWSSMSPTGSTQQSVTGLNNGVLYDFRVRARSGSPSQWSDWSAWSQTVSETPVGPAVPDAPTGLVTTAGDGEVRLSWSAPAPIANEAPITSYEVQTRSGGGVWSRWGTVRSSGATVRPLTNGTSYQFRVAARNSEGSSPWSQSASATPKAPARRPATMAAPVLSAGDGSIGVSWSEPDDNGADVQGYDIDVGQSGSSVRERGFQVGSSRTSTTLSGFSNGRGYWVKIRARNSAGRGEWSPQSTIRLTPDPVDPPSMRSVSVSVSGSSLTARWSANDNGSPITSYDVTISGSGSFTTSATSRTWSNLRPGTYTVTVRARNTHGLGPAGSDSARIGPTDPPSRPSVSVSVDGSTLTARWSANDNGTPIQHFKVRLNAAATVRTTETSMTWRNLSSGDYTVTVSARNGHGIGPAGSDVGEIVEPSPDCSVVSLGTVNGSVSRSGRLERGCTSSLRGSSDVSYFARRYRFVVGSNSSVHIDLGPAVGTVLDTYLYLLNSSGRLIEADDNGGRGTDSQIVRELNAGTYIVEATTSYPWWLGSFTVRVTASDSTTVIIPEPPRSVTLAKGSSAQGQPGCRSRYCRFLNVSLNNFQSGSYRFECHSTSGRFYSQVLSSSRISRPVCYFGFPGENVWVVVDGVRSNSVRW